MQGIITNACRIGLAVAALEAGAADTYRIDSANTQVGFHVQRFGMRWVNADFRNISGEFVLDPQAASGHVDVTVQIASIDCRDPQWNERLRSHEWLDAARYPEMSFHSDRIQIADGHATATGRLTLHGMTHEVALMISFQPCGSAKPCQFKGHARIKRSDYGLPHGFWIGGDQVDISIQGLVSAEPR